MVGINEDMIFRTMDAITNAISDSCEPRIRPDVTLQTVDNKTVIVVEILPGAMRPYYIKSAYQYVLEKINMGMEIHGIYRQDIYELPTDSVREIIANAAAHRSYLEPGNIQVAIFDDRLEVTSPGMLLNNVSISKMMEGYSKPRNPAIATAFAYMKIIEKWGTGILRIFRECQEYGLPKPELIDFDGDFRVNMYRNTEDKKVTEKENEVLLLLNENPSYTMIKLAEKLNISRKTVAVRLKKLREKGVIERVGSDRTGYWNIIK